MSDRLAARAGSAVLWHAVQLLGSKVISLARFLILARLLAPDEFGLLAIGAVAVELIVALSNFGVNEALVQKETIEERDFHTAWTLRVLRALAVAGVTVLLAPVLASAFGEPAATPFIRVLAFRPLVDAVGSIKLVTLTRSLDVRPVAAVRLATAALETAGSVLLAVLLPALLVDATVSVALVASLGAWAVVAGTLAGALLGMVLSYVLAPYRPQPAFDRPATVELLRFGRWLFLTSTVGVIGHVVLRAIISRELGVAELGIFYLGVKLTLLPNDLAGEVIRAVAFPVVSRVQSDAARARRVFQSSLTAMFLLLVPAYATLLALAQPLVRHVLGQQWEQMVPVIQLLALDGIIDILADATKPLVLGLGHAERRALLKGVRTTVILVAAWPLVGEFGLAGAAGAFLMAEGVQLVVAYAVVRRTLPRPFAGMGRPLATIAAAGTAGAGVAWLINDTVSGLVGFGLAIVASALLVVTLLASADRRLRLGIRRDFSSAFPGVATLLGVEVDPE